LERRPRSVRHPAAVSSAAGNAPMTADVRRAPEEGNVVSMRFQTHAPTLAHVKSVHDARGTRPSLGPSTRARQSSLCSSAKAAEVRRANRHHGWANPCKWEEPTLGSVRTDEARLAACHRFRKGRERGTSEKEGGRGLRPCEDQEPGFGFSHVVVQLQKSVGDGWPRISSANALQKERSGSSERGPSSERRSAGDTVGNRVERRVRRRLGHTGERRAWPAPGSGWREIVIQRFNHRVSGEWVAGPGL
jgi:hypothetical protein